MAHREFIDDDGAQWQAWEVIPTSAERRSRSERRFGGRDRADRRVKSQLRVRRDDGLEHGWLVFECAGEKRRLHPIPEGWSTMSDTELVLLARRASPGVRGND